MQGQTWLNEDLGGPELPDPTRQGETATTVAVVEGFLRNDGGRFTPEEVELYVNRALQDEAGDLRRNYDEGVSLFSDRNAALHSGDFESDDEGFAAEIATVNMFETTNQAQYDTGRVEFADAVVIARESQRVRLEPETCAFIVRLDDDGFMSKAMGFNVGSTFGVNPPSTGEKTLRLPTPTRIDFSRNAVQPHGSFVSSVEPQADKPVVPRRGLVSVGTAVDEVLGKLDPEQSHTGAVNKDTAPELG